MPDVAPGSWARGSAAGSCRGRVAFGHLRPGRQVRRHGLLHGFNHGPRVFFAVEVVDDLPAIVVAFAAEHLPAGFGPDQLDLAPGYAPLPVIPLLDHLRHEPILEQTFEPFKSVRR